MSSTLAYCRFVHVCIFIFVWGLCVTGTPQIIDAVKDKSITLRCNISGETASEPSISWTGTVNSTIRTFYSVSSCPPTIDIPGSAVRGFTGGCETANGMEIYRLTVPNVTVDMERFTWRCTLERLGSPTVNLSEIKLNVKVMVRRAEITNLPNTVLADKSTNIICVTSRSKPEACIRMFLHKEGRTREITTGQPVCNQDSNNILPTTRTQVFTPIAEDNGSNLYCTANNSVTDTPVLSRDYRLNVEYTPKSSITVSGYVSNSLVEPGPISLTCDVGEGNPEPTLTWSSVCAGRVPDNNGRQTITLNVDRSLNGKSCSCRGNQAGSLAKWTGNKSVTFNVTFGPDSVNLTSDSGQSGDRVHVAENTTVRLTCTGGESNPPAILTWYRNNSIGQTALLDTTRGDNNGYIVSGRYTLIPDRYMDGRAVRCEAGRPGQQTSGNTSIILDVKYISLENCKYSYIFVENQTASISCTSWSKPAVEFNWKRVHRSLVSQTKNLPNHRQQSTLTFTGINRSDSGVYTLTINNTAGEVHHTVNVTIYYAPDVYVLNGSNTEVVEGEDLILECRGQGQPNNITYTEWSHFIRDTDIPLSPRQPGQRLRIRNVRFQDQGTYRCGATNGFGGVKVNTTNVRIKAIPQYPNQSTILYTRLGANTTITVYFVSNPLPEKITWYGVSNNSMSQIQNSNTVLIHNITKEDSLQSFTFSNKLIQLPGQIAQLSLLQVSRSDVQSYTMVIENEVGNSNLTISLQISDAPSTPDFTRLFCTESKVTLNWISNFNGGSEQTFSIQRKTATSNWITLEKDIRDLGENQKMFQGLIGQKADQRYIYRIVATNNLGNASTEKNCTVTADLAAKPPEGSPLTGPVAGGVSVGVLLLVIVALIFVFRGKLSTKLGKKERIDGEPFSVIGNNERGAGDYEDVDRPPVENMNENGNNLKARPYVSKRGKKSSPYEDVDVDPVDGIFIQQNNIQPDKLPPEYAEVNKDRNKTKNQTPAEYAEVNKGPKKSSSKKDTIPPLYAEVNKNTQKTKLKKDPTPVVYAEVNKVPKKLSSKKEPTPVLYAEVNKDTKKTNLKKGFMGMLKKKTSTPDLSKSTVENRLKDDQNLKGLTSADKSCLVKDTPNRKLDNTYANAAFNGDDVQYYNTPDVVVPAAAKKSVPKTSHEELVYADMDFPAASGVIHTSEDTTTYASIQHGVVGPLPEKEQVEKEENPTQ